MRKLALLLVALGFWFYNPEEQRLEFSQVLVANRQVNAEPIPQLAVAISQVGIEPPSQVACQSDVVEFAAPVERVNTLSVPDILSDNFLVLGERIATDVLNVLADQL